ncbi:SigE family RNA polymerase sigma factor [Oerskovia paurometabola]|uniref:SigE family RNA polymerase sigma factor n=1 Tax=Oerskovia paurometabola TaxID=162170 RepID=A0ABW1X969_9CELL|nr:SigE family RNA polymerase sigma factor [Oerskovia paurometabola]MBM7499115.1 RNA polymerase sigma-70 factor (sigma-E family) [Oerskovia paurometabola]
MTAVLPLVGGGDLQGGPRRVPDDGAPDLFDQQFDEGFPAEEGEGGGVILRASRNAEFTAFMEQAVGPLHRMAYLLCGDQHRAEELTQQTFERTYRAWSRARDGDPIVYARRILANLRVDTWRRTRREVLSGPDDLRDHSEGTTDAPRAGSSVGAAPATVDDRDLVVRALLQLPLKQRRVVVMRHMLDLSETEVSTELGIPVGTVKSTASRALARLRAILDDSSRKGSSS